MRLFVRARGLLFALAVYIFVSWQPVFAAPLGPCARLAANRLRPISQQIHLVWGNPKALLPPDKMVSMNVWRRWRAEDYLKHDGELLAFETPDSRSLNDWPIVEVMAFGRLSTVEKKAVLMIFSELAQREAEVELGVLVINKKIGEPEIHFVNNNLRSHIDGQKAIAPLAKSNIEDKNIESIQFWHNHPSRGPLSISDITMTKKWAKFFGMDNPTRYPFHMYSLANFDGQFVVFHFGTP